MHSLPHVWWRKVTDVTLRIFPAMPSV
jgi:hypothetical protein